MQVVFIGPAFAGKTTLVRLVAPEFELCAVDLDEIADGYYREVRRGVDEFLERAARTDFESAYRWWQQGHPHAVKRVLEDHPDAMVALGAGHTYYLDDTLFASVAALLQDRYPILVLPSPDLNESIRILRARAIDSSGSDWRHGGIDLIERWVRDPANHMLASWTVYTEDRPPSETAQHIVRHLHGLPDTPS